MNISSTVASDASAVSVIATLQSIQIQVPEFFSEAKNGRFDLGIHRNPRGSLGIFRTHTAPTPRPKPRGSSSASVEGQITWVTESYWPQNGSKLGYSPTNWMLNWMVNTKHDQYLEYLTISESPVLTNVQTCPNGFVEKWGTLKIHLVYHNASH